MARMGKLNFNISQLSLAPWRYRNITDSKIISSISYYTYQNIDNKLVYEVNCKLSPDLVSKQKPESFIYGSSDGTGTSYHKNIATYKAISEALERWAFYNSSSQNPVDFGFNINSTTTGMAAFPGLNRNHVRQLALFEGMERWVLANWWKEKLKFDFVFEKDKIYCWKPKNLYYDSHTLLLVYENPLPHFFAYGFACHQNFDSALEKAKVELSRNINVLKLFYSKKETFNYEKLDIFEKRLLFFSTSEGHAQVLDKLNKTFSQNTETTGPTIIIDKEIVGDWTKYCFVWRVLFENTELPAKEIEQFFF